MYPAHHSPAAKELLPPAAATTEQRYRRQKAPATKHCPLATLACMASECTHPFPNVKAHSTPAASSSTQPLPQLLIHSRLGLRSTACARVRCSGLLLPHWHCSRCCAAPKSLCPAGCHARLGCVRDAGRPRHATSAPSCWNGALGTCSCWSRAAREGCGGRGGSAAGLQRSSKGRGGVRNAHASTACSTADAGTPTAGLGGQRRHVRLRAAATAIACVHSSCVCVCVCGQCSTSV